MIFHSGNLSNASKLDADVCIVGGGAAGISIALKMSGNGAKILVLESGFDGYDERAQSLYAGENIGHPADPLNEARLRMLGGSTNHWAGNCMPLDPIDFEARPGIPHSGWPISRSDLDLYYPAAQELVETPSDTLYDTSEHFSKIPDHPIAFDESKLTSYLYALSPPTQFGYVYEDRLKQASDISLVLNATVLEILTDDTASQVTGLRVAGIDGPAFEVQAKLFVLAQGAAETARLLLLSDNVETRGLGNSNDLVGRYFMDHVSFRPALQAMVARDNSQFRIYTEEHPVGEHYMRCAIRASEDLLRAEQLPNFRFIFFHEETGSPGQSSATTIKRALEKGHAPDNLRWHLANVLSDLDGLTNEVYRTLLRSEEDLIRRDWIEPWLSVESLPNPDSRVLLTADRDDIFGQRRIALDWRLTNADLAANRRATEVLAAELARLGYGRAWSVLFREDYDWPKPTTYGKHHTGTTRMSEDPKHGVVDENCRVHGISNLFVAGSAVFPTQGHATPTLTIVALAVRLADHLKARLAEGQP
ncbi:GMC oxidoreductase [Alloyangia pacifica]|uniref:Choline dehydrogenase n=1 Tax=Alloyangia pacifica TaxID=311180 RepID=A0A1I6WF70_9RHOB|nr:GMC family oxidoreductase [Alloyangia pacifica]SDI61508.1 Choline dehydrogenase [Alloyangia pacifica]SFT24214.1 Choline dehydrogenase [Alloyangia pacifica]